MMPMQDVEFGRRGSVNDSSQDTQRHKMSGGINHQPSKREPWGVIDDPGRMGNRVCPCNPVVLDELRKGLKPVDGSVHGGSTERCVATYPYAELVGLIYSPSQVR